MTSLHDCISQEERAEAIAEHGKSLLRNMNVAVLQSLPRGHYMMIDVPTGEFITAPSLSKAIDLFKQKFPAGTGFVHRIGENLLPRRPIA